MSRGCDDGRVIRPAHLLSAGLCAALLVPGATAAADPTSVTVPAALGARSAVVPEPPIRQRLIPFGHQRKQQMARYSRIHYGEPTWRLDPVGIVQHFTATRSLSSVFATFRSNAPDPELGQRPGVCAHFVIDQDGTIYQVVRPTIRCRHTVGLNHRMIGVEHVGMSDGEVMGNPRQRRSSLKLSAWLATTYDIATGDIIGHNESRSSRFHRERYGPWRCQTHGDFAHATMQRYRRALNARLADSDVDRSAPRWVDPHC